MSNRLEKIVILLICSIGLCGVAYGMLKKNNFVFIIGLIFVIGGYLLIRKKLKESMKDKP